MSLDSELERYYRLEANRLQREADEWQRQQPGFYPLPEPKPEDCPNFAGYDYAILNPTVRILGWLGVAAISVASLTLGNYGVSSEDPMDCFAYLMLATLLGCGAVGLLVKITEKVPYFYVRTK